MNIPETYVVEKFYQYGGYPRYKKSSNTYEAGCPICREGNSWNRKRRLYYIPTDHVICCHNCGWYGDTLKWIIEVSGQTYSEIVNDINKNEFNVVDISTLSAEKVQLPDVPSLPRDSINLGSSEQVSYYSDNKIVQLAVEYINKRRLNTAVNKPGGLYLSLTDPVHKNRLILPSYENNKVVYYQTRSLLEDDDRPKYLSKMSADRNVFGIENVTDVYPYIYIFEGPIDSFFVENGVAIYGIQEKSKNSLTQHQHEILSNIYYMNKIWVLDNQHVDQASNLKSRMLLQKGERVFIWPRGLEQFKDFNEMCIKYELNEVSQKFIEDNTHSGTDAILKLSL